MKIELKHLAPYLPYGLKIRCFRKGEKLFLEDIILTGEILDYILSEDANRYNYHKPILRNLSDLTKEIERNGEKFIPIYKLWELAGFEIGRGQYIEETPNFIKTSNLGTAQEFRISTFDILSSNYNVIQKLLEWHFDIFGLIEQGLAIDLNTL